MPSFTLTHLSSTCKKKNFFLICSSNFPRLSLFFRRQFKRIRSVRRRTNPIKSSFARLHTALVKESSPGNTQQMKAINNFRRTIKSPLINRSLIKSAFVSRGWAIATLPVCGDRDISPLQSILSETVCARGTFRKPETRSCPNEFSHSLCSELSGFIIVTLLMRNAAVKEINTTSVRSRGRRRLSRSLFDFLPSWVFVLYVWLPLNLVCCVLFLNVSFTLPLPSSLLSLFNQTVCRIRTKTTDQMPPDLGSKSKSVRNCVWIGVWITRLRFLLIAF